MGEAIKPTFNKPISPLSKGYQKGFDKSLSRDQVNLNEIDSMLGEAEQSLKKKIFSLAKMEALTFSDPKLSAVYEEMAENGEEKYGYHYNETIMNMLFNDYVLNSPKYLQKYKQAVPKEKKRRDKSGINQLKHAGEDMQTRNLEPEQPKPVLNKESEMEETTGAGGAGGGGAFSGSGQYTAPLGYKKPVMEDELEEPGPPTEPDEEDCVISSDGNKYSVGCAGKFLGNFVEWDDAMNKVITWQEANKWYPNIWFISDHGNVSIIDREGNIINETTGSGSSGAYYGPAMWGSGDLMKTKGKAKVKTTPMIKGGTIIAESNYLTESTGFEKFIESLNEDISYQQELGKQYQQSHTGSNNGLGVSEIPQSPERAKLKSGIDDNTALFIGQDVDRMRDDDVKILHNDMTKNNTMFPHPDNPNLPDDGISGLNVMTQAQSKTKPFVKVGNNEKDKVNDFIIDKTSAFTSDAVKDWDSSDRNLELNTLETGQPDQPNLQTMEESKKIDEKAVSKKQQKFMGMVHAVQKGELSPSKVGGDVADAAASMKPKDAEDFASTKHKGLPEKVKPKKVNEETGMAEYVLTVKHDNGTTNIKTTASSEDAAKKKIMAAEGCPENAITNIKMTKKLEEEAQSMISDSPDTMANKAQPIGTQSGNMDTGARSTGGGGISESVNLLEEINKELEAFSIHQDKLKRMTEDRKPSALVLKDRLGNDNEKNFKKDLKDSSVSKLVDIENSLEYNDQQTDVPKNPYELGEKLEKGEKKATEAESGEALKNVGDSANDKGDEIPKRNLSKEEQDEVNLYRVGLGDYVYDNEVGKRFEDRMKKDMGDKLYELRQKKLAFRGKAPMYNKDPQPVEDTTADKVQFDKEQTGWNERMGLKESMITGKYKDFLGKKRIIDFNLNEVWEVKTAEPTEFLCELNLEGLGNTYTQKVSVNENVVKAMSGNKFFTNGVEVFVFKAPVQNLNESEQKTGKPVVNEQMEKMKHLVGYNTSTFVKQSKIL